MKAYSGIGSRNTPEPILEQMEALGRELAGFGYTLYSGGADGADSAFEKGCDQVLGSKQIFLPWKGFNNNYSKYFIQPKEAEEIAKSIHPAWKACSYGARKLHSRNVQQVLGYDLKTPTSFVICWTLDGKHSGGTATAIKLAIQIGVPVFNLAIKGDIIKLRKFMDVCFDKKGQLMGIEDK